jgi:hypothetical protein
MKSNTAARLSGPEISTGFRSNSISSALKKWQLIETPNTSTDNRVNSSFRPSGKSVPISDGKLDCVHAPEKRVAYPRSTMKRAAFVQSSRSALKT